MVLAEFTLPAASTQRAVPFEWRVQDVGAPQFQVEVAGLDAKPIQRPFGRFVFTIDPDGILVEFVEPAARVR